MTFSLMVSKQRALKSWIWICWIWNQNVGGQQGWILENACESSWSCGGLQWSIPLRVSWPSHSTTAVTAKEEAGEGGCATASTILTTNHLFWNASDDQINCQGNLTELRALVILDCPRNNDILITCSFLHEHLTQNDCWSSSFAESAQEQLRNLSSSQQCSALLSSQVSNTLTFKCAAHAVMASRPEQQKERKTQSC